jgi:glutamate formiminotransferase / 5-formyltetrahydrofolate cyclo-ligase
VLACVVNVSEGRDRAVLDALAAAAGPDLLDLHVDPHHHRAVLTLVGEESPRAVAAEAVRRIDLRRHAGAHPRLGAVDVVPFVPLADAAMAEATAARDRFSAWVAGELRLPAFRYGADGPSLPEVRRAAPRRRPDHGGPLPHPTAGAVAVGARDVLVAYNVVLAEPDLDRARAVAAAVRGPALRALGLRVGDEVQVSMNLVAPAEAGPAAAYDAVATRAPVRRAELVGLVPEAVLRSVDPERWAALDLAEDRTIEARVAARAAR